MTTIAVWPHPRVTGWDGRPATLGAAPGFAVLPLVEALTRRWPTDAHATGYQIPTEEAPGTLIPRLTVAALATLIDQDAEPVMGCVFVDVDNPGHEPWRNRAEAADAVARILEHLDGTDADGAIAYTTRAGLRLVWQPAAPPRASAYRAWMLGNDGAGGFLGYVSKRAGIPIARDGSGGIDPTCAEWSRCFRLPWVVRDGVTTDPHYDPGSGVATSWVPRYTPQRGMAAPPEGSADQGYADGIPPLPSADDVPAATWSALAEHPILSRYFDSLRYGRPLAGKGSRDTTLIRVIGALVHVTGSDPLDAWRIVARAVAADTTEGAPTPAKAWEKCRAFAAREIQRAEATAAAKARPPVLYGGGSRFWTLDHGAGTYRPPVSAAALVAALESWGPPGLTTRGPTGKPRETSEILAEFGAPVVSVIAEMGRTRTDYDPALNGGTLLEACCAVRSDVEPRYHEQIAKWLDLLGGATAGKLLDWIATVTDTARPTACLYVEGPPAAGKGMLAAGLAALWGAGATSYHDATGAFNGALAVCPLVLVDEGIQTLGGRADGFSAGFRTLIGESSRPLRRKFQEPATIVGCPRVIVAANNADALRIRERLTAHDVDAIAQRILYVRAPLSAAAYLEQIGGRAATAEWVTRDEGRRAGLIAEHALWLRANRAVTPGTRFLVAGEMSDFHRDLSLTSGLTGDALAVVAHVIDAGRRLPGFLWGGGEVAVNAPAVRRAWASALQASPPGDAEVAATLRALATDTRRVATPGGYLRHYVIPVEHVIRISEIHQISDPETLLARVNGEGSGVIPFPRPEVM